MAMSASKILAGEKADDLIEQGSKLLDKSKSGHSDRASELLTKANEKLYDAGLITGKLMK